MSMQDRIDMYNRDLEDQDLEEPGNTELHERVRKTSVVFNQPQTSIDGVQHVVEAESFC